MEEAPAGSAKDLACARVAALRTDHTFCDASLVVSEETFPIHLSIVAEVSPVFMAAFCGDFKEGHEKSMTLKTSSSAVMHVILDYSNGICIEARLAEFDICLEVLENAEMYQISGLRDLAFALAMQNFLRHHIVEIVKHVELCGSEKEKRSAYANLAENIVEVAKHSPAFWELSSDQVRYTIKCTLLIGTEDEMLDIILKWIEKSPDAPKVETEPLFAHIRLEILESMNRIE